MALNFNAEIPCGEIARALSNSAEDTANVIDCLADIYDDEGDADDFAGDVAQEFSGSATMAKRAGYLLRAIAEKLEGI